MGQQGKQWHPKSEPPVAPRPRPPVFTTPRLTATPLTQTHYPSLLAVYGDPESMRYVDDGSPITPEDAQRWIEVTRANFEKRGYGMSAILVRATQDLIGFCGLVHPGDQPQPELKYAYHKAHWGKGYATEAAIGMLEYGRRVHGMTHVMATTAPENVASHRVLTKAGMREAGIRIEADGERIQVFEWRAPSEPIPRPGETT